MTERQIQILEVSQKLFLHYGFQKVSLVDIAKEIGVSRPTVYQAFPNKEEIFKALIAVRNDRALAEISEYTANSSDSVREKLSRVLEIWVIEPFELINSSPGENDFQGGGFCFADEAIDEGYLALEKVVETVLKASTNQKIPSKDKAHLVCRAARGLKLIATDPKHLRSEIDTLVQLATRD